MARLLKRRLRAAGLPDGDLPARAAPHVRDAPPAGRRRPARDPGAARPRLALDDAEVHAPRRGAAARGVPECPPQSVRRLVRVRGFAVCGLRWPPAPVGATGAAAAVLPPVARGDRPARPREVLRPEAEGSRLERRRRESRRRSSRATRPPRRSRTRSTTASSRPSRIPTRSALPAGKLPDRDWATAGLRIGRDGERLRGQGRRSRRRRRPRGHEDRRPRSRRSTARRTGGTASASAISSSSSRAYPGTAVEVTWQSAGGEAAHRRLVRHARGAGRGAGLEERAGDPARREELRIRAALGDERRDGARRRGPALRPRRDRARSRPALAGWEAIEGFLLDVRGNSGGYDPNILRDLSARALERRRLLLIARDGKAALPARVQAAARRAADQLGHGVGGRGAGAEVPRTGSGRSSASRPPGWRAAARRPSASPTARCCGYSARAIEDLDGKILRGPGRRAGRRRAPTGRRPARAGGSDRRRGGEGSRSSR